MLEKSSLTSIHQIKHAEEQMHLCLRYKIRPAETDNNNNQNGFPKLWTVFKGDSNGTPELHF